MNELLKINSQWKRESKTGSIQANFFKGGVSSVKLRESSNKLNKNGGYFMLDGAYSLDVIEKIYYNWMNDKRVGNVTVFYSTGQSVGIHEETTIKI